MAGWPNRDRVVVLLTSAEPVKILVVDDDVLLQSTLARTIRAAGLGVIQLLDGVKAVEVAVAKRPALIILDVNMPTTDGRDILRDLKRDPRTARIPVFMYSARASQHDRKMALELGADEYFDKPLEPRLLLSRIIQRLEKP